MLRAMALYRRMEAEGASEAAAALAPKIEELDNPDAPDASPPEEKIVAEDGTVTPIDAAQRKRGDGPRPA